MPTVQQILDDIDSRYRNTFTDAQKVDWMNTVQKQIFQFVPHEATPYTFTTVADTSFYALPSDCEPQNINHITIERKAGAEDFKELEYKDQSAVVNDTQEFYTILNNMIYINPKPTSTTEGKDVYLYYDKKPTALSTTSLGATPDLEENFHELLVFGVLERVCAARKDSAMKSNYANDFEFLFNRYQDIYKNTYPEYLVTKDVLPKRTSRYRTGKVVGSITNTLNS